MPDLVKIWMGDNGEILGDACFASGVPNPVLTQFLSVPRKESCLEPWRDVASQNEQVWFDHGSFLCSKKKEMTLDFSL